MGRRKRANKKSIKRTCLVCGGKISIKLFQSKQYRGGHYFGKVSLPVGKGDYRKVGKFRLGGKAYPVVKWAGKEKRVEYWECNACFKS